MDETETILAVVPGAFVVVVLALHTFAFLVVVAVGAADDDDLLLLLLLLVVVLLFFVDALLLDLAALEDAAFVVVEAEVDVANLATVGKLLFSTPSRLALCPCLEKPGVTFAAAACKNLC